MIVTWKDKKVNVTLKNVRSEALRFYEAEVSSAVDLKTGKYLNDDELDAMQESKELEKWVFEFISGIADDYADLNDDFVYECKIKETLQ